jgi:NADPH2:quinone reductase
VIGFTGGIATLRTNLPLVKTASMVGVQLRVFGEKEPEAMAHTQGRMMALAAQGLLQPQIGKAYAFEDFRAAMAAAFAGTEAGRVVIATR